MGRPCHGDPGRDPGFPGGPEEAEPGGSAPELLPGPRGHERQRDDAPERRAPGLVQRVRGAHAPYPAARQRYVLEPPLCGRHLPVRERDSDAARGAERRSHRKGEQGRRRHIGSPPGGSGRYLRVREPQVRAQEQHAHLHGDRARLVHGVPGRHRDPGLHVPDHDGERRECRDVLGGERGLFLHGGYLHVQASLLPCRDDPGILLGPGRGPDGRGERDCRAEVLGADAAGGVGGVPVLYMRGWFSVPARKLS